MILRGGSRGEVCTVCSVTKLGAELQDGPLGRCGVIAAHGATGGAPDASMVVVAAITVTGYLLEKSGFVAARMSGPSAPAAQL